MKEKWLFALLALLAVVLLVCGVTFLFIGARLIIDQVASAPCADSSLTPEEKANCGTHTYQLEEELTSYCSTMAEDSGVKNVTAKFSENTMTTSIHDWEFTKVARNEYESVRGKLSPTSNIDRHVNTITLTMNGFTENYAYEGLDGKLIDCWVDTYTIIE